MRRQWQWRWGIVLLVVALLLATLAMCASVALCVSNDWLAGVASAAVSLSFILGAISMTDALSALEQDGRDDD